MKSVGEGEGVFMSSSLRRGVYTAAGVAVTGSGAFESADCQLCFPRT